MRKFFLKSCVPIALCLVVNVLLSSHSEARCWNVFSALADQWAAVGQERASDYAESKNYWLKPKENSPVGNIVRPTVWITGKGIAILHAPFFTTADVLLKIGEIIFRKNRLGRLARFPTDTLIDNYQNLLIYFALAAMGFNVLSDFYAQDYVYIEDLLSGHPEVFELEDDELAIFIVGDDPKAKEYILKKVAKFKDAQREDNQQNVSFMSSKDVKKVLEELGEFRSQGQLRVVHWQSHGLESDVGFDMEAGNVFDLGTIFSRGGDGELSLETLHQFEDITRKWPKDLMDENLIVFFHVCGMAAGDEGTQLGRETRRIVFQNKGTLHIPTRINARHKKQDLEKLPFKGKAFREAVLNREFNDLFKCHGKSMIAMTLLHWCGAREIYDYARGRKNEPRVKKFGEESK